MTRDEWIAAVTKSFAAHMPDEFPVSFAHYTAETLADSGAYDKFLSGQYGDKLYIPEARD